MLYIINYILQCERASQEDIDAFNNANSTGDIGQFVSSDGTLNIPCGVSEIGRQIYKYKNKNDIIKVDIPNSVTSIRESAFSYCTKLQNVNIPNEVANIEEFAFHQCTSLSSVNIPTGLTALEICIFSECTSLKKITIPSNIQKINGYMHYGIFYGPFQNSGLEEVIIEKGMTNIGEYAFLNCTNLKLINIPDSVTSIKNGAFSGCKSLTSINIPNSVTTIEAWVFLNCTSLQSITLSNSLINIEVWAFLNCSSLTSINIPDSVTSMESGAFQNCTDLISINIPNGITTIDSSTFENCYNLKSVVIPNGITTIEKQAFQNCSNLQSINIPDSVTSIGANAFENCTNLISSIVLNNVITIDEYAFLNCSSLQTITISNTIITIGCNTFENCTSLKSIIIPNKVTTIGNHTFHNCFNLKSITISNSVTVIESGAFYNCTSLTQINIPSGVTEIKQDTFYRCQNLTSIIIPDSVISIGARAFSGCKSLKSINIPDIVTIIEEEAFLSCSSLKSINIPNSVTNIRRGAFSGCRSLASANISNSVTSIEASLFSSCSNLKSIIIPNSVTNIKERAFQSCSSLTSIIIPDSVTNIEKYTFSNCYNLTQINIPNSITNIKEGIFSGCKSLIYINIPNSITTIEESAFSQCQQLQSIDIPNNVTYIGKYAFSGCSSLQSINIPNSVTRIEQYAFSNCRNLISISLPNNIDLIANYMFQNCINLQSINIPNGVTIIGFEPFYNCTNLQSIIIPDSVTEIYDYAFYNCTNLQTISISNNLVSIKQYAFSDCRSLISVLLPNTLTEIQKYAFVNCTSLSSVNIPTELIILNGGIFANCTSLKKITIPNNIQEVNCYTYYSNKEGPFSQSGLEEVIIEKGMTNIGNCMFSNCTKLQSIAIPDSITVIESYAFYNCQQLQSINIPNSITSIGAWTFSSCSNLKSISIPSSVITIDSGTFYDCKSLQSIIIPSNVTEIKDYTFENCTNLQCVQIEAQQCQIDSSAFDNTTYQGKTNPLEFNDYCEINIYTECQNNSFDYHDPNSDKCVLEAFVDHYIVQDGIKYYYEQCPNTHQLIVDSLRQCFNQCPQYYEQQDTNKCVLNPCLIPGNFYLDEYNSNFKECIKKCDNLWYQYQVNDKSVKICLTNKDNCDSVEGFKKQAGQQCVAKCSNINMYIQPRDTNNNVCVTKCIENDIQYVFYNDENNGNICTDKITCKSIEDQYKLYNSDTKECRTDCGNNDDDPAISYVWYQTIGNNSDNICTTQITCKGLSGEQYGKYKLIPGTAQCVESCTYKDNDDNEQPATWYVDSSTSENKCNTDNTCDDSLYKLDDTLECVTDCTDDYAYSFGYNNSEISIDKICSTSCAFTIENYDDTPDSKQVKICTSDNVTCPTTGKTLSYQYKESRIQCVETCKDIILQDIKYLFKTTTNKCQDKCNPDTQLWYIVSEEYTCSSEQSCGVNTNNFDKQAGQQCVQYCKYVYYFQQYDTTNKQCVSNCKDSTNTITYMWYSSEDNKEQICMNSDKCIETTIKQSEQLLNKRLRNGQQLQDQQCIASCQQDQSGNNYLYYQNGDNFCTQALQCGEQTNGFTKQHELQCIQYCKDIEYFQKDKDTINKCIEKCDEEGNKVWYADTDNICTDIEKCNAINVEGKTFKLVKGTTNNQCADNCDTDKVWYNDETDNKCSDQTDCGIAEKDVANYGKMIESTKQCVITCAKVDYYYPQGTTDKKCVQNCQIAVEETTNQVPAVWYSLESERICTSQIVCSSEQVKYGEGENQKVLKFRESQNSQQCIESCGENNVWFVFESVNQKENMCTELEKCELTGLIGYENLNKNQKQQCVNDCLGKDDEGKEISYVYYYENDEKGNMCTESVICQIQSHSELQYILDYQCVTKCNDEYFVQDTDNKCLTQCSKNDDKQLYQYQDGQNDSTLCTEKTCQQLSTDENKYYIYEMTDNQIYCTLSCNTDRTSDKPYILVSEDQQSCVSQCPENYQLVEQTCTLQEQNTSTCPEDQFIYNNNGQVECVNQCPEGYKANDNQQCVQEQDDNKLQTGQIVGIVVGIVAVVIILIVTIICIKKHKQSTSQDKEGRQMTSRVVDKA